MSEKFNIYSFFFGVVFGLIIITAVTVTYINSLEVIADPDHKHIVIQLMKNGSKDCYIVDEYARRDNRVRFNTGENSEKLLIGDFEIYENIPKDEIQSIVYFEDPEVVLEY